jgi:hypothetical protein
MKTPILISIVIVSILACNKQQVPEMGKVSAGDSLTLNQLRQRDSSIMEYIKSINMIHSSIDSLSRDARILKLHGESITSTASMIDEIRAIDKLMIRNNKSLADLRVNLNKSNIKNQELVDLGEALSLELNEKDSEIVSIQKELSKTKAYLSDVTKQLNDSVNVIAQQRTEMAVMKTEGDRVFYTSGTEEELKKKNIVTEEGGIVGLGRIPVVSQSISQAGFTAIDYHDLSGLSLNGRFVKLVTTHPLNSYRIASGTTDKLIITDPEDFWSKSKYLVVIIK